MPMATAGRYGGAGLPASQIVQPPPAARPQAFGNTYGLRIPNVAPGAVVADQWGAVQFPAQTQPVGVTYPGDPALTYVLQFLYAWLVLDSEANGPWQAQTGYPLIKSPASLLPHNPVDHVFSEAYLPALYLFRDDKAGGTVDYVAEDWFMEVSTWTLLWALPLGNQDTQRARSQYVNQFAKAVAVGIERSVTPSWVMPGDPDPGVAGRGSHLGYWTNLVRLHTNGWRKTKIVIPSANAPAREYPCVEMKFEVKERQNRTIRRFPGLGYLDQRTINPSGGVSGREFDH